MNFANSLSIQWICPWWRLTRITAETYLVRYVIYCSLTHSMTYFPDRLQRQYGQTQEIPILHNFQVSPISHRLIEGLQTRWNSRTRYPVAPPRGPPLVPNYVEWLQAQEE